MKPVTVRWLVDDHATKLPWGLDESVSMVRCLECGEKPPKEVSFIILSGTAFCHSCLKKHIEETQEVGDAG